MRDLAISLTLLLAACQPAPFETTPTQDAAPPADDTKNDKNVSNAVPLKGPFAPLDALCGSGEAARCKASEPVPGRGGGGILAVATFQDSSSETGLAIQTAKGWYIDREPGEGPMWSHHSPHSTFFDLDRLTVRPDGVSLFVTRGMSSFIGGMGNRGSSSHVRVTRRTCEVRGDAVVCEESGALYSRSCETPMEDGLPEVCKESGKKP